MNKHCNTYTNKKTKTLLLRSLSLSLSFIKKENCIDFCLIYFTTILSTHSTPLFYFYFSYYIHSTPE